MNTNTKSFPKTIYSKGAIIKAIDDYKKLAKIDLSENLEYYICDFADCVIDPERIIKEFGNYLIEIMNSSKVG